MIFNYLMKKRCVILFLFPCRLHVRPKKGYYMLARNTDGLFDTVPLTDDSD
jgi:hypothetical protein